MIKHEKGQPFSQGWHLDKRISVAHLLTTVMMAVALGAWMWALSERVTLNKQAIITHEAVVEVEIEAINARDRELMEMNNRHYQEILRRLERIEDGVSRHIESPNNHTSTPLLESYRTRGI